MRRGLFNRVLGEHPVGTAFVTPYVVFLLAVFAYPLGFAVYMSFHDYFFAAPGAIVDRPFVGFANYVTVLTDPAVQRSFLNVVIFLVINVPLTVVLSLVLANALNAAIRWRTFFRVSYYVPYVTASVAVVGVWLFLFNSNGLVNSILGPLAPDPSWLVNSKLAMPTIAIYVTWKQLGFFILLYLAALQNVSGELYEAAEMDGANRWQRFLNVTIPGVRPATTLVVLVATVTDADLFTEPKLLTGGRGPTGALPSPEPYLLTGGGGPNGASASAVLIMYQKGIEQGNPDIGSALGVLLVIRVLILALIERRFVGRED